MVTHVQTHITRVLIKFRCDEHSVLWDMSGLNIGIATNCSPLLPPLRLQKFSLHLCRRHHRRHQELCLMIINEKKKEKQRNEIEDMIQDYSMDEAWIEDIGLFLFHLQRSPYVLVCSIQQAQNSTRRSRCIVHVRTNIICTYNFFIISYIASFESSLDRYGSHVSILAVYL